MSEKFQKEEKKVWVNVQVPKSMRTQLIRKAKSLGMSTSKLVRKIYKNFIEKEC